MTKPARCWYIFWHIVLKPEIAGGAAIRALFSQGIGSWLTRGNIEFPCELFALANSVEAETLLQGFNFFKVQNAKAMPGNLPFWSEDGYEGGTRVTASSQRGGFGPSIDSARLTNTRSATVAFSTKFGG